MCVVPSFGHVKPNTLLIMKKIAVSIVGLLLLFGLDSCLMDDNPPLPNQRMDEEFKEGLTGYVESFNEIPGAWLHVQIPSEDHSDNYVYYEGFSNKEESEHLYGQSFRVASITKMFTATIILQLQEEAMLKLDDRVTEHLSYQTLEGLHSDINISKITIRDLLQHTSGIEDYVVLDWVSILLENPQRFWQPEELLEHVRNYGSPHFAPGQGYYYSDTNYVLLGLIIEEILEIPLHEAYSERVFEPLNLHNTFLEAYHSTDGYDLAHGYYDQTDVTDWSTSSDWAGGGLISTTDDLSRFMRSLVQGEPFQHEETLEMMQSWRDLNATSAYGLGIGKYRIGESTVIGHGGQGFGFNSGLYYYPEKDAIICLAVNQQHTDITGFEEAVIEIINKYN